ncbi:hypothetical protein SGLAM104S_05294 [Streptomyces glaucescens]
MPTADEVLRETVARCLPALTEPHVLAGVTGLARGVLRLAESIATFVTPPVERPKADARRTVGMFADYRPDNGDDQTLREAVGGLGNLHGWWGSEQRWSALRQIRAVNHVLSGNPADGKPLPRSARLTGAADGWRSDEFTLPRHRSGVAVRARAPAPARLPRRLADRDRDAPAGAAPAVRRDHGGDPWPPPAARCARSC